MVRTKFIQSAIVLFSVLLALSADAYAAKQTPHDLILDKLDEILEGLANDPPAPVPQTGQTECWEGNSPVIIPCGGTGQDGDLRKGVKAPSPRFTDNGDGTVADNLTGLIWLQTGNCPDFNPSGWSPALNAIALLADSQCDLTDGSEPGDWRMPNVKEFLSLIDYSFDVAPGGLPLLPSGHPFTDVLGATYWTSTNNIDGHIFGVMTGVGMLEVLINANMQTVWPVRGGQ